MLDFGITAQEKMEDYNTKFLSELTAGDKITGEILVGEFKTSPMGKREVAEFYIIITDHGNRRKWVCEFLTSYYPETDNVYGEKDGLFFTFIDTLNQVVNNTPRYWQENYSVNFNKFRRTVNKNIALITVKTIKSLNPEAKTINLEVTDVKLTSKPSISLSTSIYELAEDDPIILMAYAHLRNKGDRITVKNIRFELKSLFDDKKLTEGAYRQALEKLKTIKSND